MYKIFKTVYMIYEMSFNENETEIKVRVEFSFGEERNASRLDFNFAQVQTLDNITTICHPKKNVCFIKSFKTQ